MAGACCLSIKSTQSRDSSCTARLSGSTSSDRFRSCSSAMVCAGTACPARRQVLQTTTKCSWKRASSTIQPTRLSSRPRAAAVPMTITPLQPPPRCMSVSGGARRAWRRLSSERTRHRQLSPRRVSRPETCLQLLNHIGESWPSRMWMRLRAPGEGGGAGPGLDLWGASWGRGARTGTD